MSQNDRKAARFRSITSTGMNLVDEAEDIPLGSLAQAIARRQGLVVRLIRRADKASRGELARVYVREKGGAREILVMFSVPEQNGTESTGACDVSTRYQVAHELAHLALGHPLRKIDENGTTSGGDRVLQECEAHYLACLLIRFHGGPINRRQAEFHEIDELLQRYGIAETIRHDLLRLIQTNGRRESRGQGLTQLRQFAERTIADYESKALFRHHVEGEVMTAMSRSLQAR